ncbi:hypothetical protein ORV05_07790 [Amycolatopsis cynarae]|uniref:Uncharacterized protein n=1 Tax=Amycolatopsis cynarae TaxID=2995223 RepID=A0ABY7B8V6_9PSEU|nr:hypothetical protein [Amycolatopsis sp. HUAS 11-8]WAL67672.1 hypothetical protein ORV05_07790 [Amycolatopsis sp. HUAS 11-8]
MNQDLPTVTVRLWRAGAVVLFDWLMSTDLDSVPVTHSAQKQALADLLSRLEYDPAPDLLGVTSRRSPQRNTRSSRTWAGSRRYVLIKPPGFFAQGCPRLRDPV